MKAKVPQSLYYLSYGMLIHMILFLIFPNQKPLAPKVVRNPVELRLQHRDKSVSKKTSQPKSHDSPSKRKSTLSQNHPPDPSAKTSNQDAAKETASSYSDLLPKSSDWNEAPSKMERKADGRSSAKHHWASHLTDGEIDQILTNTDQIKGTIQLPLSARSTAELGKAKARIKFVSEDKTLHLIDIQGSPLLRAVLYENLQKSQVKQQILSILGSLQTEEMTISLHLVAGDPLRANEDSFSWNDNWLNLYIVKGLRGFSPRGIHIPKSGIGIGLTLPDEKADRAKDIDEDEYRRLKESPAYSSTLSQRVL